MPMQARVAVAAALAAVAVVTLGAQQTPPPKDDA